MSEWISPTGHNDPDGKWGNLADHEEEKAYDGDVATFVTADTVYGAGWTSFIELTQEAISCSKIRIYNRTSAGTINIDVYYNDAWHPVYDGSPTANTWIEHELGGTYSVTKARFRMYYSALGWQASVNEFDFWGVAVADEVPPVAVVLALIAVPMVSGAIMVFFGTRQL